MLSLAPSGAVAGHALDLAKIFAGLDAAPAVLLAVSGGSDSMALLHLAVRWSESRGPRLHVATVDHGLRPEAAAEAAIVAAAAALHGVAHATLAWTGSKPTTGIQEKAREARYRLLTVHARAVGAPFVLTAHHADDQAETVLMRLGRGSGVTGLAAMRRVTPLSDDIALVRPLLDMTKQDLLAVCAAERTAFVDDSSNENPIFQRVRLRQQNEMAASLGLDRPTLLRLARRMARADEALEMEVTRRMAELQPAVQPGSWCANVSNAHLMAPETFQRLIARATRHVASAQRISLEKLEPLTDALRASLEARRPYRGTLAGTLLALDERGMLSITKEPLRHRGRKRPD